MSIISSWLIFVFMNSIKKNICFDFNIRFEIKMSKNKICKNRFLKLDKYLFHIKQKKLCYTRTFFLFVKTFFVHNSFYNNFIYHLLFAFFIYQYFD